MGAEQDKADHWPEFAQVWQQVGPPLRPSAQDLGFCTDAIRDWALQRGAPRVLLLGVTPELYHLPWPKGTDFLAVDHTQAMIDTVWPGPKDAVQCANWLALSLPDSSRDLVLCDGGLHLLAYPQEQGQLVRVLRRILSDQGLCILRLYAPPPRRESPEAVLEELLEGRIPNLNVLKLRLGMSLLNSAAEGVELARIWRALHAATPDLDDLASRIGWPAEHMLGLNPYRDSTTRYHFVTVGQARHLFCDSPGGFEVHRLCTPSYELGEQCPTLILRRCPSGFAGRDPMGSRQ